MELKTFFAQDLQGNVVPNATVYLYQPGTTTLATGLKDANGDNLSNPFTATSSGRITLAAPDGYYDLRFIGSGRDASMRIRFTDPDTLRTSLSAPGGASLIATAAGITVEEALARIPGVAAFPDEFDSLAGSGSTHDDLAAFNAMIAACRADGRVPTGRAGVTYYFSNTLTFDPSKVGFEGNGCKLSFANKTFSDPAAAAEKLSDPSFDTGAPWVVSTNNTVTPTYDGRLNFLFADGTLNYLEVGQQIACGAGDLLKIVVVFDEIRSTSYVANTFRDVILSLRANTGTAAGSIGSGASVGTVGTAKNTDPQYVGAGSTFTFYVTAGAANPYLRIQSNTQVRIASISAKVMPNNTCVLFRTPADGQQRGHNYKNFRNFKILGRADQAAYVDGFYFDTQISGFASRANFYNVDVSDNIGRPLVFANRAYLMNFYSCRIVGTKTALETISGSADAGENIAFFGGNLGGGEIGIKNEAGFAIRLFGTSIDFSRQWIVGGNVTMFGGWLETNAPTVAGYPLIDVTNGEVILRQTRVQVDGSVTAVLDYPFRVAAKCFLDIEAETPYNLHGTARALCTGDGRFRFKGVGGSSKEIEPITKRDANHNILGSGGGFEDSALLPLMWMSTTQTTAVQADRTHIVWPSSVTALTATFTRGAYAMTVSSNSSLAIGNTLVGAGIRPGTIILAISGTTVTTNKRFTADGSSVAVSAHASGAYATAGMEISTSTHRTGAQSLRIFKTAIGASNLTATIAIPVEPGRAFGCEWYYKIPGGGTGTTAVYFQTFFAKVAVDEDGVPCVAGNTVFISDLPQTSIDLAAGRDWTRLASHTNRYDATSAHDGYAPLWATHMLVVINLASAPSGFEMFIDDMHANAM